jgi:hypothetical protein
MSEDARKKMRVNRLRQMNAVNTLDPSQFEQKAPDDWSRKEMLKSISALRELKKQDVI